MTTLTAKKLIVTAQELNADRDFEGNILKSVYTFPVWEFENGCIMVVDDYDCDYFFQDRGAIEADGTAVVNDVEDTEDTTEWSVEGLIKTINQNTANGYHIPESALSLVAN